MNLTGNPFVDTGLMVLTALAQRENVAELSPEDIRNVFGDGSSLVRNNKRLKSYTMVFGTNGALTQHAYKKIGKADAIYTGIMNRLLAQIADEGETGEPCDLTGIRSQLNFQRVVSESLVDAGLSVPEQKWIGRDWVPLGGSLGNDAQALPGASRALHVSALALFALQYLPLGTFLFKGKLTCYQSTAIQFTQDLVSDVVRRNNAPRNGEILGKGAGTGIIVDFLLNHFDALRDAQRFELLPDNTELLLWLFSNSGTGADCLTEAVPESALRFISDACSEHGHEIRRLIATESKDSRNQLFECVRTQRDYSGLYPYKNNPSASPKFFAFYQERVCGVNPEALTIAQTLASQMIHQATAKQLTQIRKPEFLRSAAGRAAVRRLIADQLSLAEYDALFRSTRHPIRTDGSGWNLIRFYLGQEALLAPARRECTTMKTTHPKIVQIGDAYFEQKGPKKIKAVLDRLAQRKIGVAWLQNVFCLLAEDERYKDFNLGTWDEFACDEEGKPVVFELLFQLRLYLANKYRQSITQAKETNA